MEETLKEEYGYSIAYDALQPSEEGRQIRSIFNPKTRVLHLAPNLTPDQLGFILAKELGFQYLDLKPRPLSYSWVKFNTFEEVENNFRSSYFASALMLPEKQLAADLKNWLSAPKLDLKTFSEIIRQHTDSTETFFQRMTNLLPKHLGIKRIFFLRFEMEVETGRFNLNKEFHLARTHEPHAIHGGYNYCRRWISSELLLHPDKYPAYEGMRYGAQVSKYPDSAEYFVLAASHPQKGNRRRAVCIGLELNKSIRNKISFLNDPKLDSRTVNAACELCAISDCEERVATPSLLEREQQQDNLVDYVNGFLE